MKNWTEFKNSIKWTLYDILTCEKPKEEGWQIDSDYYGYNYTWDGFGYHPFKGLIYKVKDFETSFKNELLKCSNDYEDDETQTEKVESALAAVCWKIPDYFVYLLEAKQRLIDAQEDLENYEINEPDNEPEREDFADDEDGEREFEDAMDDYNDYYYWLEDKQTAVQKAQEEYGVEYERFWKEFKELELEAFYV